MSKIYTDLIVKVNPSGEELDDYCAALGEVVSFYHFRATEDILDVNLKHGCVRGDFHCHGNTDEHKNITITIERYNPYER